MSVSHLENSVIESEPNLETIRDTVKSLLLRIKSPYTVAPYAQDLHDLCCNTAIERGYPIGIDSSIPSLLPSIPVGVTIAAISYGHLEDEETRVFIALLTAFLTYVDDSCVRVKDNERVRAFIGRFLRQEKQLDPVLDSFSDFLLGIRDYYEPVAANIILTSALGYVNSNILDIQTQDMEVSLHAKRYPEFVRRMSGMPDAFAVMIFPRTISVQRYTQCMPEAANFINYSNDVLSFYKEELEHETANHISVLARCQGLPKMTAFEQVANDVAEAHERVCRVLEGDQEVYQMWQSFKDGYVGFHTSAERYRLHELMN